MKKLAIGVLLVLCACHRQGSGATTGAATPREALERFLSTAKAQDYEGMATVWGSAKGPISSTQDRTALQQRQFVVMKCLRHDRYVVLNETQGASGARLFAVEVRLNETVVASTFTAVQGPSDRWYLENFRIEEFQPICTSL